jgi:Fic family protein
MLKIETFRAGIFRRQYEYRSFSPTQVNVQWSWEDPTINTLLERASRSLAELNAFSLIVPNVDWFIKMHVVKEANMSSRIEGTQTGMDEAVMKKELITPERRDDWQEVHNYIDAMNTAIAELAKLPLSNRLLKQTHGILMRGVRGQHKAPGEFRSSQNWIGGTSLQDAMFIPPAPEEVAPLMSDLELFWHNQKIDVPHLVRIAISHYQFETIHPFLDGNGRIGRLLITLYLVSNGLLAKPSLYLSAHLERNKGAYYDALTLVRTRNDLTHWIKFFFVSVAETAEAGKETFKKILLLHARMEEKIAGMGRGVPNARRVLAQLYQTPTTTAADVAAKIRISVPTARALLKKFEELHILEEVTAMKSHRVYSFGEYLALF